MVFVCAIDVKQQQNSFSPLPQPDMEIINRTTWKLCWVTGLTACHILGKKSSPASCICLVNRVFWSVTGGSMSWNSITLLLGKTRLSPCFWNGARSQRKNGNSMGVRWGNWDNYMSMYSIVCIILYIYIYTRTAELSSWLISRDHFFLSTCFQEEDLAHLRQDPQGHVNCSHVENTTRTGLPSG